MSREELEAEFASDDPSAYPTLYSQLSTRNHQMSLSVGVTGSRCIPAKPHVVVLQSFLEILRQFTACATYAGKLRQSAPLTQFSSTLQEKGWKSSPFLH
jgi:hypothetical protein